MIENKELLQQKANYEKNFIESGIEQLKKENLALQKENKELKEKVTELEAVIAKLSQKILNKSNY